MKNEFPIDFEIYSKSILNEAILDFSEIAKIELDKNSLVIEWKSIDEINEFFNEFMNYVISLEC